MHLFDNVVKNQMVDLLAFIVQVVLQGFVTSCLEFFFPRVGSCFDLLCFLGGSCFDFVCSLFGSSYQGCSLLLLNL